MKLTELIYWLDEQLGELAYLRQAMSEEKTPEGIANRVLRMNKLINSISLETRRYSADELSRAFRQAYEGEKGEGAIPKVAADRMYRLRQRNTKAMDRAAGDMRKWVQASEDAIRKKKSFEALEKLIPKLDAQVKSARANGLTPAQTQELKDRLAKAKATYAASKEKTPVRDLSTPRPTVYYRARYRKGKRKGKWYVKEYDAAAYYRMALTTNTRHAENLGRISAAMNKGATTILCWDGSGCGVRSHDDAEKANGRRFTIEEAFKYPRAHPYCQRQFAEELKAFEDPRGLTAGQALRVLAPGAQAAVRALRNPYVQSVLAASLMGGAVSPMSIAERALRMPRYGKVGRTMLRLALP